MHLASFLLLIHIHATIRYDSDPVKVEGSDRSNTMTSTLTYQSGRTILWTLLILLLGIASAQAVPPDTLISNTAQVTYTLGSQSGLSVPSNTVEHTTQSLRTPSSATLMQYASSTAGKSQLPPTGSINPQDLTTATIFKKGDIVFVVVDDRDQNIDTTSEDRVQVTVSVNITGDVKVLQLTETGPDTGIFMGYVRTAAPISDTAAATSGDATLTVTDACQIRCAYEDAADPSDQSFAVALVDPYGLVFDSATGLPVDGAQITLMDTLSGLPATVFGDDGTSSFPASITSGAMVTDSSGRIYDLPTGSYRFPIVAPGTYQLAVNPPGGYTAPSTVPTADLQRLPNGPFVIAEPGSRSEPFTLNPGPAFRADIPIDPQTASFWLAKNANRDLVSVGEYVQYILEIENLTPGTVTGIMLIDQLPNGFRYQPDATGYHFELARDSDFKDVIVDATVKDNRFSKNDLIPGNYYWRLSTLVDDAESYVSKTQRLHLIRKLAPPELLANHPPETVYYRKQTPTVGFAWRRSNRCSP